MISNCTNCNFTKRRKTLTPLRQHKNEKFVIILYFTNRRITYPPIRRIKFSFLNSITEIYLGLSLHQTRFFALFSTIEKTLKRF